MELRASITPAGVSKLSKVQFDFKRTKETKTWVKNGAGAWTLHTIGNSPVGSNDDPNNKDEDLNNKDDIIWVIDSPGWGEPNGIATHDFLKREMQFAEWVELVLNQESNSVIVRPGIRASSNVNWYNVLSILKGTDGKWKRDDSNGSNKIRLGTISIGANPQH